MLRFVLTNVLVTNKAEMAICTKQQDILNYFSDVYIVQIGTEDESAYEHMNMYLSTLIISCIYHYFENKIIIISNDKCVNLTKMCA